MGKKRQFANPENPEKLLKLRLHDVSDAAAGITGVKVASNPYSTIVINGNPVWAT